MRDPRVDGLAKVIVRYSLDLQEGQTFMISAGVVAEPLVQAIFEQALEVGAHPLLDLSLERTQEAFYRLAGDAQLDWVSPTQKWAFDEVTVLIAGADVEAVVVLPRGESDQEPVALAAAEIGRAHV